MKVPKGGKAYFYWLGRMDRQTGRYTPVKHMEQKGIPLDMVYRYQAGYYKGSFI